jgi:heme/copper-type cytochrome/quinol oxidase subunit 3
MTTSESALSSRPGLKRGGGLETRGRVGNPPLESRKLAVWLFLGSEIVFFAALIFTYVVVRLTSPNWPEHHQIAEVLDIPVTAVNTFILILSSVSVVLALESISGGNKRGLRVWLLVTLALGVTFLSIQAFEYRQLLADGLSITRTPIEGTDRLFGTTFFTMTGFHGMHVLGGVLTLAVVLSKALRGLYDQREHLGVELFGLYWHFVDVVWIILFTIVYLI